MSNRTLMEFNHDVAGFAVARDPTRFAHLIDEVMRCGPAVRPEVLRDLHRTFGVTVGPMRHHSSPAPFETPLWREP